MDKKKLWLLAGALVLVAVLILVLVLGGDAGEKENKKLPQIGLCLRAYEEAPQYGQLLEKTFKEAGFRVTILDAKNDQTRQTAQVADLVKGEAALLVIEPVIADAASDTVQLLMEKNIPAVFIGNKPVPALEQWNRLSFVGSAKGQLGSLQAELILQSEARGDLNEDGEVSCLVISGPEEDGDAQLQAEGCIDALVAEGLIVDQLDTSWGEWTEDSGRMRCAKALSQFGKDVEVIVCGSPEITLGALEAVKAGGWQIGKDYTLIGVGAEEKLQTKELTGTVVFDLPQMAQQVLSAAQSLMKGDGAEKEYYVNYQAITGETE